MGRNRLRRGKINLWLALIFLGIAATVVVGVFAWFWALASPFDDLTPEAYETQLREFLAANMSEGTQSKNSAAPVVELERLDNGPIVRSGEQLVVRVMFPEPGDSTQTVAPKLVVTLPKTRLRGLPRFRVVQDAETAVWSLHVCSPKLRDDYDSQLSSSAWSKLDGKSEKYVGQQDEEYEDDEGQQDETHNWYPPIELPLGRVQVNEPKMLASNEYQKVAAAAVSDESIANWVELWQDQAAKESLRALLHKREVSWIADQHLKDGLTTDQLKSTLENLSPLCVTLALQKKEERSDQPSGEIEEKLRFDGSRLRWLGSLRFRKANAISPVVEIRVQYDGIHYEIDVIGEGGSDPSAANDAFEAEKIFRYQKSCAVGFEFTEDENVWAGADWLIKGEALSLNPVTFYGMLQCLYATHDAASKNDEEVKTAQEKTWRLITSLDSGTIGSLGERFKQIRNSPDYHATYLACYFGLDLLQLWNIAKDKDDRGKFDERGLVDLLLEVGSTVAKNVDTNGRFRRALSAPDQGYDRSVGQIALYFLGYLFLETREILEGIEKDLLAVELAPTRKEDLLKMKEFLEGKLPDALERLAREYHSQKAGVPYQEGAPSNNLQPGYFLASVVLLQLGKLSKADFQNDLRALEAYFDAKAPKYPDGTNSPRDAYRWKYWARVSELLQHAKTDTVKEGPERGKLKFPEHFSNSTAVADINTVLGRKVSTGFVTIHIGGPWKPSSDISIGPQQGYEPAEVKHALKMIALQTVREMRRRRGADQ